VNLKKVKFKYQFRLLLDFGISNVHIFDPVALVLSQGMKGMSSLLQMKGRLVVVNKIL
jgi:hypothetical protein